MLVRAGALTRELDPINMLLLVALFTYYVLRTGSTLAHSGWVFGISAKTASVYFLTMILALEHWFDSAMPLTSTLTYER